MCQAASAGPEVCGFLFFLRFLTSALYGRDVGMVFMSSVYKTGLDRLGCSSCLSLLWVIIHIPWSGHSNCEIQPRGHITSSDCFHLAGLRLFAVFITCIKDAHRPQFSAAPPNVTCENLQPIQCRRRGFIYPQKSGGVSVEDPARRTKSLSAAFSAKHRSLGKNLVPCYFPWALLS